MATRMYGRSYRRLLLRLSRYRSYNHLHPQRCKPSRCLSFRWHLPDRLGLRYWYRLRHYHLRFYFRWAFQSGHYDLFRCLARVSMEKSSTLYLLADFWRIYSWNALNGDVLARNTGIQEGEHSFWKGLGIQWRTSQYSVHVPQSSSDVSSSLWRGQWKCILTDIQQQLGLSLHDRILRRLLHRYRHLGLSRPREPLCLSSRRSLRYRSRIRNYGLGIRRYCHQHQLGS